MISKATGVVIIAAVIVGNAVTALVPLNFYLRAVVLWLLIWNVKLRLSRPAPVKAGQPPSSPLSWPSRLLWKILGESTSLHLAFTAIYSRSLAVWSSDAGVGRTLLEFSLIAIIFVTSYGSFFQISAM